MDGYRISELAERRGFSNSTLRFYEQLQALEVRAPAGAEELARALFDYSGRRPKSWQNFE